MKVAVKKLKDISDALSKLKCKHVTLRCFPKGILVKGALANGSPSGVFILGEISQEEIQMASKKKEAPHNDEAIVEMLREFSLVLVDSEEDQKDPKVYRIKMSYFKPFGKSNNLSEPTSLARFYYKQEEPLVVVLPVGQFGTITLHIRDDASLG